MDAMEMLAERYAFNTNAVRGLARGMAGDDWSTRHAGTNPAHWVLGHIAVYRRRIARELGVDIPEAAWEEAFKKGTQPDDCSGYPAPEELLGDIKEYSDAIAAAMPALTAQQRDAAWATFAGKDHTLESGLSFLYFHETYHVGQLSQL
ncbi:MAG: DinB family protein, partial [Planctomycetota bacterium]